MIKPILVKLAQLIEAIPIEKNVEPPTSRRGANYVPDYFHLDGTSACLIPWITHLLASEEADLVLNDWSCQYSWLYSSQWAKVAGTPKDVAHRLYYVAAYNESPNPIIIDKWWQQFVADHPFETCKKAAL